MGESDKEHKKELEEMIKEKKSKQPVEEILAIFCHRHGTSMNVCRSYYRELVKSGQIKEE